jgi:hypothetical protein
MAVDKPWAVVSTVSDRGQSAGEVLFRSVSEQGARRFVSRQRLRGVDVEYRPEGSTPAKTGAREKRNVLVRVTIDVMVEIPSRTRESKAAEGIIVATHSRVGKAIYAEIKSRQVIEE